MICTDTNRGCDLNVSELHWSEALSERQVYHIQQQQDAYKDQEHWVWDYLGGEGRGGEGRGGEGKGKERKRNMEGEGSTCILLIIAD